MKKWMVAAGVVVVLLAGTGYGVYKFALNAAADGIATMLENDPEVAKLLESEALNQVDELLGQEGTGAATSEAQSDAKKPNAKAHNSGAAGGSKSSTSDSSTSSGNGNESGTGGNKSKEATLAFQTREEAVLFAKSRFSAAEIKKYLAMVNDGLTEEEKVQLKSVAYAKFTAAEIKALLGAVQK